MPVATQTSTAAISISSWMHNANAQARIPNSDDGPRRDGAPLCGRETAAGPANSGVNDMDMAKLVCQTAQSHPAKPALVDEARTYTFGEMDALSSGFAARLL